MKCAIVDLGSNTIRLSLYNTLENGGFETLFSKKYMAGLAGYVSHGIMSNDGINQACAVLLDFKDSSAAAQRKRYACIRYRISP